MKTTSGISRSFIRRVIQKKLSVQKIEKDVRYENQL